MDQKVRHLVLAALMAALCCAATMAVAIPAPTGYVNLGDCVVLLSGWLLGAAWGGAAAGVGTMLADLFNGYAAYAPATLIIKFLMAAALGLLLRGGQRSFPRATAGAVLAEGIMAGGYFAFESLILGVGAAAAASVPANLLQGAVGAAAALAVLTVLERSRALEHLRG